MSSPRVRAMSRFTPQPGGPAIVLFPHAGGSPRFYNPWCRELPAGVSLYGVTYPGRDGLLRVPAPDTLTDLASDCAAELEPIVGSAGAVVMFGHSMGSYVALETIRILERSGIPVRALAASASEAPHLAFERRAAEAWHRASDDALVRRICKLDANSEEVFAVPELRQMFLPIVRDDYRLIENYRADPDPQLACPIHIMRGESDPEVTQSGSAGWAAYTRADAPIRDFPGDHFYLAAQPAQVIAYLSGILSGP